MKPRTLIVSADEQEFQGLSAVVGRWGYAARHASSLAELRQILEEGPCAAVLIDLDTVRVDNRAIRELVSDLTAVPLLGISCERVHADLKDSIRDHIYACLHKPVDPDELCYWLKCIREDGSKPAREPKKAEESISPKKEAK